MSKFPIEKTDQEGINDAINYLLSGPGGLGQNFAGFSGYTTAYLTGNFRIPFTVASINKVGNGVIGEFTIVIAPNTDGVDIGYSVVGPGIGASAVVTAIDYNPEGGYTITLDVANDDDIEDKTIIFYPPPPIPVINVNPRIDCSSAIQLDGRTFQYNFLTTQPSPPFANGNNLRGSNWADDFYNGYQGAIGVIKCTTDYVIFRTAQTYPGTTNDYGGGKVYVNNMRVAMSTDCNARVTVTGATDRVFITGQLDNIISYTSTTGGDLTYRVQLNRYAGLPNNDPVNPDFVFVLTGTIAEKTYTFTGLTVSDTLDLVETTFSTVVDSPPPGYYWYILEVLFDAGGSDIVVDTSEFGLRSLSAQVVKQ